MTSPLPPGFVRIVDPKKPGGTLVLSATDFKPGVHVLADDARLGPTGAIVPNPRPSDEATIANTLKAATKQLADVFGATVDPVESPAERFDPVVQEEQRRKRGRPRKNVIDAYDLPDKR